MIKQRDATAPTLGFTLGEEELVLLIALMRARTIPGLPEAPYEGLSEGEIMLKMAAAEHSLAARGLLRATGPDQAEIDPVVAALVGACIVPDVSYLATLRTPDGSEARYYHEHDATGVIVQHSFPEPFLHAFQAVERQGELAALISEFLGLGVQSALGGKAGRVSQGALDVARESIEAGKADIATTTLTRGGLPEETARALVRATMQASANGSLVKVAHGQDQIGGFATLVGEGGLCLLVPEGEDSDPWVRVEPISGKEARARVKALCAEG